MIFRETWRNIIADDMGWHDYQIKTETRRPCKRNEFIIFLPPNNVATIKTLFKNLRSRVKWQVGRTYAIQPGMYQPSIGRIQILHLWREPLTSITRGGAVREGFSSIQDFQSTWIELYGKKGKFSWYTNPDVWGICFKVVEVYRDLAVKLPGAPHVIRRASRSTA